SAPRREIASRSISQGRNGIYRSKFDAICPRAWPGYPPGCSMSRHCRIGAKSPQRVIRTGGSSTVMTELAQGIANVFGILIVLVAVAGVLTWIERRLLGLWQDRYGPNRVGPFGTLQVVADMIKLLFKQDWIPPFADRLVFVLAPAIIMATVLLAFAVIPIAPGIGITDLGNIGILFFLAMSSLSVYSAVLAGWASNSKYAL